MTLQAGTYAELEVVKEMEPYGYFLTDGEQDILLRYSEVAKDDAPVVGETIRVFLFHDREDRLSAAFKNSLIELGKLALLEVADVHPHLGCFLDMGIGRQLLLPPSDLPELEQLWPTVGDKVYVILAHDKQQRMIANLAGERELAPMTIQAPTTWHNQWMDCRVYNPMMERTFCIVEGGILGFGAIGMIHETEQVRLLRLGERVSVRVTFVREDGRVNLSMKPLKEISRDADANLILSALKELPDGAMPYSDESAPDEIMNKFKISKSAFKRALGKLMKEGLVVQQNGWTHLQKAADSNKE